MSPRTPKQNKERRTEKKQQIIDVALKLFADSSYHATSISKIAKEAGISKGLMYNYFDSKEDLLKAIVDEISANTMDMINPDHDDEITSQEMEDFFSLMIDNLKNNSEYWKLYYQLTLQKDVLEHLTKINQIEEVQIKYYQLLYKYFAERFENPEVEMLIFSSVFKGFSIQYVFASGLFNDKLISDFKEKLIKLFVKDKM